MTKAHSILADTVAKHMRTDPTRIQSALSVAEALDYVRDHETGSRIVYFYVVDDQDRLIGVVPTRRLLRAKRTDSVASLMVSPVISIPESASVLDACEFFTMHRLFAFPVVDKESKLVGVVDIDLYTDEMANVEKRREGDDLFQLVGVFLTDAEQRQALVSARKRFPWLMCNVVGGVIAAIIADAYADVATLALVTPFIALVTAMAEGVAIQSVSLALQSLHGRRPTISSLIRKLGREVLVSTLLGIICGVIVGVLAMVWKGNGKAGLALGIGIAGGVIVSSAVGFVLPFLLRLLRRDPLVASGPIVLAFADMATLLLYFSLGRWLIA